MSKSMTRISGRLVDSETAVLGRRRRRHKDEATNEFCKLCATLNTEPNPEYIKIFAVLEIDLSYIPVFKSE